MPKPSICLASIVKNEAHIIERCLESAAPWVDSFYIIDTGSQDDTVQTIINKMQELGIPGSVDREEWVDFAFNRSSLLRKASRRGADYLLLLDADMEVTGEEGVLDQLGADGYQIQQGTVGFKWWMPYLVRTDKPWKFVGSTHEFLTCDEPFELTRLYGFEIDHHGDGGTRPEKATRDLAFLEKDWAMGVMPDRTSFYLAQTYQDMGETEKALDFYRKRIDMGGWDEEVYIANMRVADLTGNLADYLRAHAARPSRSEAVYHAIKMMNEANCQWLGYELAVKAFDGLKSGDALFVDTWIEEWGLLFEMGISYWHAGHVDQAKTIFEGLLKVPTLPDYMIESVNHNLSFC